MTITVACPPEKPLANKVCQGADLGIEKGFSNIALPKLVIQGHLERLDIGTGLIKSGHVVTEVERKMVVIERNVFQACQKADTSPHPDIRA